MSASDAPVVEEVLEALPFAVFRRSGGDLQAMNALARERLSWCRQEKTDPLDGVQPTTIRKLTDGSELICHTPDAAAGRLLDQQAQFVDQICRQQGLSQHGAAMHHDVRASSLFKLGNGFDHVAVDDDRVVPVRFIQR